MRTVIYIDGFNLYYRMLKRAPEYKWINLKVLAEQVLDPSNDVIGVNYYTARVSARVNPRGPRNQQVYLDALATVPEIQVHFGNFQVNKAYAPIVGNASAKPVFLPQPTTATLDPWPDVVRIMKTEEKGSDVNLGSHLVRDAFQDKFDVAAVITNDTDLVEPIRIVTQEVGKKVGVLSPVSRTAGSLQSVASFVRHIRPAHLLAAQFPDPLPRNPESDLVKPVEWV
ncbi:MAG: NYN domain-containing protein [Rhodobacteraceae bacterium]|nr:NYN domain-containing protein [Paracoccaceae bacterium]